MFKIQLTPPQWLQLSQQEREQLIQLFNIPKSGVCEVDTERGVISDGHGYEDLACITIEKMKDYTGLDSENFMELFSATLDKINGRINSSEPETGHLKTKYGETNKKTSSKKGRKD